MPHPALPPTTPRPDSPNEGHATLRIVGMARSGNHAIINWILNQLEGRWAFLNCVEPKTNPFASARPLDNGQSLLTSEDGLRQGGEDAIRAGVDTLIFSQEDTFLGPALGPEASALQKVGSAGADLVILRDPYTLMASRKRFGWRAIPPKTERRVWIQHARRARDRQRFGARPLIPVLYNRWVQDKGYRAALAHRLGLRFTDRDWDRTAACGGGSSFRSGGHGVLDRWRAYAHDPDYWALIDEEMQGLAAELFGMEHPLAERAPQRADPVHA